jgi:uncharacterized protein YcfJ
MKHSVLFAVLGLAAAGVAAQEVGNVISATPVIQQVAVPRTHCAPGMAQGEPYTSGMGGLAGGIAGAAIGSTIGHGGGTAAAMLLGTIGGALLGNSVEANNMRAQQAAVPNCVTEQAIENRTVGYDVTYEYAGRQYTTRLPHDPGPTVRLQVAPMAQGGTLPAVPAATAPAAPVQGVAGTVSAPPIQGVAVAPAPQPIAVAPAVVQSAPQTISVSPAVGSAPMVVQSYPPAYPAYPAYSAYPAYPAYPVYPAYRPYYYPPVGVSLGFVFRGGGHHHHGGGGRWR